MMRLHNTLTRSVEEFTPQGDSVSFYSCGPTVYDYQTIGNYTAYIRWDILYRTLIMKFPVEWYMNITDVGHLVSDADAGEDKLEKGARREGKTAWDVAKFYTDDFVDNLGKLNISVPIENLVKATDNIEEQIQLIETLEERGNTYQINDGIYFDSSKFSGYGEMAKLDIEGLQAGARIDIGEKKSPTDFALWKFTPTNQKRDMEWDSPWGKGFPGWHIECSAMAMKYLGETLDIHSGGIDHIPVHHTNEIAQSESATGKQFSRFWLHSNFLKVDGNKMAKSAGNGYTLDDISEKSFSPMDFRMFVLQSHYQTGANFTWDNLTAAKNRLIDLQAVADLRFQPDKTAPLITGKLEEYKKFIIDALEDNLNTPLALSEISSFVSIAGEQGINDKDVELFDNFIGWLDERLGFNLLKSVDITPEQKVKLQHRQEARKNKDWELSDKIRDELKTDGIALSDMANQTAWYRLN